MNELSGIFIQFNFSKHTFVYNSQKKTSATYNNLCQSLIPNLYPT